ELTEGERASGDFEIAFIRGGELKEHPHLGPALVELARRVKKTRAPAEGCRSSAALGDDATQVGGTTEVHPVEVGLNADVSVAAELIEQPHNRTSNGRHAIEQAFGAPNLDAGLGERRGGQLRLLVEQAAGRDLCRLDVGLIKG